jgi:Tfp pilus assembly protein PilF
MSDEPINSSQPGSRLKRAMLAILVTVALAWWFGGGSYWPRMQATNALAMHDADTAEWFVRMAIRIGPQNSQNQLLLARVQREQGDIAGFEQTLESAQELGVAARLIEIERLLAQAQSGRLEGIQGRLDRLLVTGEADGRVVLDAYVNGCLAAARLPQAEALITGWLSAFPDDVQPLYFKGRLLMFYNRNVDAAVVFQSALQKQPQHYPAAYLLGQILMQENRPEEAIVQFERASHMTFNAAPRIAQARALRSISKIDEARAILTSLMALSAEDTTKSFQRVGDRHEGLPTQLELGNLELAAGNSHEALQWLDPAVEANPGDLSARHARGIALRGAGRGEEATLELQAVKDARLALREVDELGDLVNKNPSLIQERVRIGELYLLHESKLTGEYWLKSALARDPHQKRAHQLLAELYDSYAARDSRYTQLANRHREQSIALEATD